MLFHLLRPLLSRLLGGVLGTTQKSYKSPNGFHMIDGAAGKSSSRNRRDPGTVHPMSPNLTFGESEERIVENVKMDDFKFAGIGSERPSGGIIVSNQVEITYAHGDGRLSGHAQRRQGN